MLRRLAHSGRSELSHSRPSKASVLFLFGGGGMGGGFQTWLGEGGAMPGWRTRSGAPKAFASHASSLIRTHAPTYLAALDLLGDGVGGVEEVDARAVVLRGLAHLIMIGTPPKKAAVWVVGVCWFVSNTLNERGR